MPIASRIVRAYIVKPLARICAFGKLGCLEFTNQDRTCIKEYFDGWSGSLFRRASFEPGSIAISCLGSLECDRILDGKAQTCQGSVVMTMIQSRRHW